MPGFRIRGLAQKRAIAIALRGLGKLRRAPRAAVDLGRSAKTVGSVTLHETLPGAAAKIIGKGVADAPFMVGSTVKARQAMPENVKRFGTAIFGHKGALGEGVKKLQTVIHKFQRSKVRAPGIKMAAGVAGKMAGETSKVVGVMGRQALETVGETKYGRVLAGTHRVAQSLLESPLPKPGTGLVPQVGSAMRDVRHTITGRLGLKLRRKIAPRAQGLRQFIHSAIGGKRTPFSTAKVRVREGSPVVEGMSSDLRTRALQKVAPITERRRDAASSIRRGLEGLATLRQRGGIREAGGLAAAKSEVKTARSFITKGFEAHRDIRRVVRHKGLQDIPLIEPAIVGGVAGYYVGKKIKEVGAEMQRQKARREASASADVLFEGEKQRLKANNPWLTDTEIEDRAHEITRRHLLVSRESEMRLQERSSRRILEREAVADRAARQRNVRELGKRTADRTQTRSPRESTLNSIKGKLGRLGELFGGGKKPKRSARRRKRK